MEKCGLMVRGTTLPLPSRGSKQDGGDCQSLMWLKWKRARGRAWGKEGVDDRGSEDVKVTWTEMENG